VDIGLERDAFLYVSDFFEMEDDEEGIEPLPVAKPYEVRPSEPRPEPVQLSRPESSEASATFEGGFAEEGEVEGNGGNGHAAAGRENGEGGGRRWRGRRGRRRGGRDRGIPESKFAHPQNTEAVAEETPDETFEQPIYKPIILPGESIAKFRQQEPKAPEPTVESHPAIEEQAVETAEPETTVTPEPVQEERPREESPRERRRWWQRGRDRDRDRDRDRAERQAEPERPYAPIVLPGESISKYRNMQPQTAVQQSEGSSTIAEEVSHAGAVGQESSWAPAREDYRAEAEEDAGSFVAPTIEEELEETHHSPAILEHNDDVREEEQHEKIRELDEPRYEQMNVASVFGGEESERETSGVDADENEEETHEFHASRDDEQASEGHEEERPIASLPDYRVAPQGAFEEEEFDADEEDDLPHPAESLYENEDFEELEEETLEPMAHAAKELAQALNETGAIQEISGGYEGDEEENGEIEEIENAAYAEIGDPQNASAELRGPSSTAAYQQRSATRPEFDRRGGRGRRGGRRMGRGGPRRESMQRQHVMISELLKEGQEVLIQIAKEPIGKKGARITSHIALPGRFLVYMPTVNHTGVSRKINSDEERLRLKRIVQSERENGHGGFIVRTAAAGISEEDLRNDIRFLKSLWHDIRTRADNSKSPALIYHDLNLVERTMRDLVTNDFTAIWADTEQEYERINRFVSRFQPSLVRRVKLYTKTTPLFEQFGIDAEINKALKSKVWLKSGGYIVINQTEALVAIDINTGKYVGKTTRLEDTIFKTNLDAIKEIVRQIRLRDLGGIIVIDFIDMDERKNRQKIMQALEEEMRTDRAPSKVLQFNDFGLVAITRKRVKQSLERTLGTPCPYCTGNGYVKSPPTVCNEIYVEMRKMAKQFDGDILLRVNPEVAKALKANNGKWLMEMEELTGQNILVKSDATLHQEQFDM
jgi:ribonuclease G